MIENLQAWLLRLVLSDGIFMTLLVVPGIIVWELLRPANKAPLTHYLFGAKYWIVNIVILTVLTPLISIAVARVLNYLGLGMIDLTHLGMPGIWGALLAVLVGTFVADFFYYWFHRTLHANKYLWQTHLLHHSDEHMNAFTAQRGHFTETLVSPLFVAIPTAMLFQLPPVTIGILSLIPYAYLFFAHANVRADFGPLWWLLISPDYHRIHHSIELRHRDKNFTNWFPIWDLLFGTAYLPEKDECPETGVEGVQVKTIAQALWLPFAGWWEMYRSRQTDRTRSADRGSAE